MNKGTHFIGQPTQAGSCVAEKAANHRLNHNHTVLQLIFKGVGRHPKTGKKKGDIKVHENIHANEGVPSDIRFTSAATNDSFMLRQRGYRRSRQGIHRL